MKKLILLIFLVPTLIIAASSKSYSQASDSTTAPPAQTETTVVGKGKTVPFLIEQIKNERELNAAKDDRINDLETEVTIERENSASVSRSYEAAKSENSNLKSANDSLHQADSLNKQTIGLLQTDNAKQKEKAKKAIKDKWKAIGVAAVVIALKFLIN